MDWTAAYWIRRRKRWTRRIARDLRDIGPLLGVLLCVLTAAGTIEAIERVPIPRERRPVTLVQARRVVPPPAAVASGPPSALAGLWSEVRRRAPKSPSARSR